MAVLGAEAMPLDEGVEVVSAMLGEEGAGELDGAEGLFLEGNPLAAEFVLQKAVVEAGVVGDEDLAGEPVEKFFCNLVKGGRIGHHAVGDAGELFDEGGEGLLRVDQGRPFPVGLAIRHLAQADFDDPVVQGIGAGGFEVEEHEILRKHR